MSAPDAQPSSTDEKSADEKSSDKKKHGGSIVTVLIAFVANLLIAIAKTIAALMTGSASMLAEAAHSWADTVNEVFLIFAERLADRNRDVKHPLGYGKESYVWSMFAAMGLFAAGAVVSVMRGVTELMNPEPAGDFLIAYIVLAVSFVLEGTSFTQAYRQVHARAEKRAQGTLETVLATSNPTLRAVFAEDSAALIGLLLAGAGIVLHEFTGDALYDAIGSILIGLLLAVVAIILIERNRRFLVGQTTSPEIREAVITKLLTHHEIDRVTYLHLEYVGPEHLYLVAAVDLVGNESESDVAEVLRRIEGEVERDEHITEAIFTLSRPGDPSLRAGATSDRSGSPESR